jgi:predicted DNA-binding transcriptional regulator YafY
MYHPTTRLLAMLEMLQSRGRLSGVELADRLEVDRRSVRRYVETLQDLGIPIEGTRGPYGGYRLLPGYKLPPLLFTEDEAVALTLGLVSLRRWGLTMTSVTVEGALAKLERVLPNTARTRVKAVQTHLALESTVQNTAVESTMVVQLSTAAAEGHSQRLLYQSQRGESTERVVDPYGVVNWTRSWYMVGYCHLRQAPRMFRLDRIKRVTADDGRFEPPVDFDYLGYVIDHIVGWGGANPIEVVLGLSIDEARRLVPPGYGLLEPDPEGVLLRSQTENLDWFAQFLLGLECSLAVRRPEDLKVALRRVARKALKVAQKA